MTSPKPTFYNKVVRARRLATNPTPGLFLLSNSKLHPLSARSCPLLLRPAPIPPLLLHKFPKPQPRTP